MRRIPGATVGWLSAIVASAPAATIAGPVVSDGERWAAWPTAPGTVVVLDDRTGRRTQLSVPDCPLGGVGGGRLVLQCPNPAPDEDPPYQPMSSSGRWAVEYVPSACGPC